MVVYRHHQSTKQDIGLQDMTDLGDRRALEDGTVICNEHAAIEMLYRGLDLQNLIMSPSEDVELFNQANRRLDAGLPEIIVSDHGIYPNVDWYSLWLTPPEFEDIDVRGFCLSMCDDDVKRARVKEEMDLYEERGMLPVLRHLIFMVDDLRQRKITWGVGRGSSVSSYVLYLIGINRIDPLRFSLDIREFLK